VVQPFRCSVGGVRAAAAHRRCCLACVLWLCSGCGSWPAPAAAGQPSACLLPSHQTGWWHEPAAPQQRCCTSTRCRCSITPGCAAGLLWGWGGCRTYDSCCCGLQQQQAHLIGHSTCLWDAATRTLSAAAAAGPGPVVLHSLQVAACRTQCYAATAAATAAAARP
jgi:hypothetical protein